jgi:hypothetical protein
MLNFLKSSGLYRFGLNRLKMNFILTRPFSSIVSMAAAKHSVPLVDYDDAVVNTKGRKTSATKPKGIGKPTKIDSNEEKKVSPIKKVGANVKKTLAQTKPTKVISKESDVKESGRGRGRKATTENVESMKKADSVTKKATKVPAAEKPKGRSNSTTPKKTDIEEADKPKGRSKSAVIPVVQAAKTKGRTTTPKETGTVVESDKPKGRSKSVASKNIAASTKDSTGTPKGKSKSVEKVETNKPKARSATAKKIVGEKQDETPKRNVKKVKTPDTETDQSKVDAKKKTNDYFIKKRFFQKMNEAKQAKKAAANH